MLRFICRRVIRSVLTLIIVLLVTFGLTRIAYSDPAATLAPRDADAQQINAVRLALHLNYPWYVQLWDYLGRGPEVEGTPTGLLHWPPSLGYSFLQGEGVTPLILSKISATASLAIGAVMIWMTLSLLLGVASARHPGSWTDRIISGLCAVGLSIPTFVTGILLSFFLFFKLSTYGLRWFPDGGYVPLTQNPFEWFRHLLLPWATIAIAEISIFQRVVRASMLDVLSADYIRFARAKGATERRVYFDHALKAALNPIITLSALDLAGIMGGAIVTEQIFGIDGVGRLAIDSALNGDYPVVIGTTLFASFIFILSTLIVDVITRLRDPASATVLD
jgi:peptide/nickel transport system permease protein